MDSFDPSNNVPVRTDEAGPLQLRLFFGLQYVHFQ